jgi:hypothetical protein
LQRQRRTRQRYFHIIESHRADIHAKTEKDKSEILTNTEKDKAEILAKTEKDKAEILTIIEKVKSEILTKTEKDKRELISWMIGLFVAFSALMITAMWAILTFALKK